MPELVEITVNGSKVSVPKGVQLIEALDSIGLNVPRFCYHPRLEPVGMCRMCLVEVSGPRGATLQPACFIKVAENMEVATESERVAKAQHGVIEFLLANHPLDCPVCDKGGECPLQDQTFAHGPGETRFVEEKRHYAKPISISSLIKLDRERCIQCDRCTRFADEVAGDPLIDFYGRGDRLMVSTFPSSNFDSYFSGNVVQICPVGALTATPYRFKARPWDLIQAATTCDCCAVGCQEVLQASVGQFTRSLGVDSENINQSWLCDRGRFAFAEANSREDRVLTASLAGEGARRDVSWSLALSTVGKAIKLARSSNKAVGFIGAGSLTNESSFAFARLAREVVHSDLVDGVAGYSGFLSRWSNRMASIEEATSADWLVVLDCDPKEELPILYLRLRNAIKKGLKVIEVRSAPSSLSQMAKHQVRFDPSNWIKVIDEVKSLVANPDDRVVFLVGHSNQAMSQAVDLEILDQLLDKWPQAKILSGLAHPNLHGAFFAGLAPSAVDSGSGTAGFSQIVQAALDGQVGVLFLLDLDLETLGFDVSMLEQLAERTFMVSVSRYWTETTSHSSVVLPLASLGEERGTSVNIEGRLLRIAEVLKPAGQAKRGWEIAALIAGELNQDMGFYALGDVISAMSSRRSVFKGVDRMPFAGLIDGPLLPIGTRSHTEEGPRLLDPMATPGISSVISQGLDFSVGNALVPEVAASSAGTNLPEITSDLTSATYQLDSTSTVAVSSGAESEGYALVAVVRLYDASAELRANPYLSKFIEPPIAKLAPKTMASLGLEDGDKVSLIRDGVKVELEVETEKNLDEGLVLVSGLDGDVRRLFSSTWPTVILERC
jgi:NADH-quinone oxidoreductase subunit G